MGLPEADRNRWQTAVASAGERVSAADGPNVEIARECTLPVASSLLAGSWWPAAGGFKLWAKTVGARAGPGWSAGHGGLSAGRPCPARRGA